jgi:L-amino acid N-acyltransferase
MLEIRLAKKIDLPAITDIYNSAILKTTATFDTIEKTMAEQENWFSKHNEQHPIFVANINGKVVGWASLSAWSDRCAYSETAEVSFYVDENYRGQGIGKKLLEKLDLVAPKIGLHTLVSRIAGESEISIHLHKLYGFELVGTMKQVGRKFGKLLDVHLMQKIYTSS